MIKTRGEMCIGSASILSFVAVLLLTLVYVGQVNTSLVPRGVSMATVNVAGYHDALKAAFGGVDPIDGLYTTKASAPLGQFAGLRQEYRFGLSSHCAYVNGKQGTCGDHTTASKFRPYYAIASDMPLNYSQFSNAVIPQSNFRNDDYLASFSRTAFYMLLLGFVLSGCSLIFGICKHTCTFYFSTLFAILSSLFLLLGAALWTAAVKKAESINGQLVDLPSTSAPTSVGIVVSAGHGLAMTWAAFAFMSASVLPYMISCCTYRG